jgi:hypothetical protein
MPILIFVQVAIMTLYVKGFKVDREKVAKLVGARDIDDPLVETGISVIVNRLNRSAYLRIEGGYELSSSDGERHLHLIIALEIGADKDELKKKDLGEIDESIREALPHVLVGRTFGSFGNDVSLGVR